jgi:mannose-6-phosphate isomerase-like protein (cupin superfamily)
MKTPLMFALLIGLFAARATAAEPPPAPPTEVVYLDHTKTDAAFAKGMSLLQSTSYKISTSRRVGPGTVEVHERDTDIFYVVEGSATFVTGGTVVGGKPSGPSEIRGAEITGGVARTLSKGDVIVVPNGVPHWFKDVRGAIAYLVIKVTK